MFFKIVVLCIVAGGSFSVEAQIREGLTDCLVDNEIYKQFAEQTAYSMINGTLTTAEYNITGCDPEKFWLLSRHGAANPSKEIMDGFEELETLILAINESSSDGCAALREWIFNKNEMYEALSEKGSKELQDVAGRYKDGFKDLFESVDNFQYRHAEEERTKQSYEKFREALEQVNVTADVVEGKEDMLLKFYESCAKWTDNNKKQDESDSEASKFESSDKFIATIANITRNLGLTETLTIEQVNKIWDMCRYEAWNNSESSPWCLAFKDDIDVMEYREDLKSYYKVGHGFGINSRVACHTVSDMLNYLETDEPIPKVIAYFAHASTIQLFLTALGVRKDNDDLKANNFDDMQGRKWRSSDISPFASNLAVVKYTCTVGEPKVKFFLNEKPLKFDWCIDSTDDSCKLSQVTEQYHLFKEVDCANYYCSSEAKIHYEVFYIVLGSIFIYLY